jgi:hypothetical protein
MLGIALGDVWLSMLQTLAKLQFLLDSAPEDRFSRLTIN